MVVALMTPREKNAGKENGLFRFFERERVQLKELSKTSQRSLGRWLGSVRQRSHVEQCDNFFSLDVSSDLCVKLGIHISLTRGNKMCPIVSPSGFLFLFFGSGGGEEGRKGIILIKQFKKKCSLTKVLGII